MTIGPGQAGPPNILGFFFYERSNRRLTQFHLLSGREQRRQIRGYQRVNPDASEREARQAIASQRRKGFTARTGPVATPEQAERTAEYQQRSSRSRMGAQTLRNVTAKGPMKVAVDLNGYGVVLLVSGLNKRDRQIVYRHWMAMLHYVETGEESGWISYGRPSVAKMFQAQSVSGINAAATSKRYRNRGLDSFRGVTVGGPLTTGVEYNTGNDAGSGPFLLLTDLTEVERLAVNREIDPENFYPNASTEIAQAA
jgi:hypothetical protein